MSIRHRLHKKHGDIYDLNEYCLTSEEYKACEQLRKSRCKTVYNIKKRIKFWIKKKYLVFLITFTFNEKSLELSENYRKSIITRLLNVNSKDYMAIKAFGEKDGREHFHALIASESPSFIKAESFKKYDAKYGYSDIRKVYETTEDIRKLSNYLASNKTDALLYSTSRITYKKHTEWGTHQEAKKLGVKKYHKKE